MNYANNKKVAFNYEILEKYEGGLELLGLEVKSVRAKKVDLAGSYVILRGKELFLVGSTISPYQVNNTPDNYDPVRPRRILVTKKELKKIERSESQKGLTLVPISLYNRGSKIKLSFAIVKGKKKTDKRGAIREREDNLLIKRTLKRNR